MEKDLKRQSSDLGEDPEKLEDAFYVPLESSIADMRGTLGPGTNRVSTCTVRQATEGLAHFMDIQGEETRRRGIAIVYDSRRQSPELAMEAAKTLAYHNAPSYIFGGLRLTPELPLAVRHLETFTGVMVTASHSPAAYDGCEVYGEGGGQIPSAGVDTLAKYVCEVSNPLKVEISSDEEAKRGGLTTIIGEEVDAAYLEEIKAVTTDRELVETTGKDLKLVYTLLHGTGKMLGECALKRAGFEQFVPVPG